jgi:DNA-binding GntR family transcriptional regulator
LTSPREKSRLIHDLDADQSSMTVKRVNKRSMLPAYAQMANILRSAISNGQYPPGARLPSESAIAKANGVSAMTARQAVSVLEREGLVHRIQGKGTFVRRIGISTSSFDLDTLANVFADKKNLSVRIVNTAIKKSPGKERIVLGLAPDEPVILVKRVIFHHKEPFTLHESYTKFDPKSPTVESMLDTVVLTELIFQEGYSNFKQGVLRLLPSQLAEDDAELLAWDKDESVFKLEHLFYDFDNQPAAFGWFIVSPDKMPLISKIGIWDE